MPFTFANVLCKLGSKLIGCGDATSMEDSISTLDKVRRLAIIGHEEKISKAPPLLLTDSLIPSELFLSAKARLLVELEPLLELCPL